MSSSKAFEAVESKTFLSPPAQISVTLNNKTGDPLSNLQIQVVNKMGLNIGEIRPSKRSKVFRNIFSNNPNIETLLNYKEISFAINCEIPSIVVENFFFAPLNVKSSTDPHFLKISFNQGTIAEEKTFFYPLCKAKESLNLEIGENPSEKGFLKGFL